jgi:hypothetical protein
MVSSRVYDRLCFEAAALAAGILGNNSLAAQTIVINSGSLLWQVGFSLLLDTFWISYRNYYADR